MGSREIVRVRHGSMVVQDHCGNIEIAAAHQGGIIHQGRVVIEKADWFDLYLAMRGYLMDRMCLECGSDDPHCQCWNDD